MPWAPSSPVPPNSIPSALASRTQRWPRLPRAQPLLFRDGEHQHHQPQHHGGHSSGCPKRHGTAHPWRNAGTRSLSGGSCTQPESCQREKPQKSRRNGTLRNHSVSQKASSHHSQRPELHLRSPRGSHTLGTTPRSPPSRAGSGSPTPSPAGSNPPSPGSATEHRGQHREGSVLAQGSTSTGLGTSRILPALPCSLHACG